MTNQEIVENLRAYEAKVKLLIQEHQELLAEYNSQQELITIQVELVHAQQDKINNQDAEIYRLKEIIKNLEQDIEKQTKAKTTKTVAKLKKEVERLNKRLEFECEPTQLSKEELYKDFYRLREMNRNLIKKNRGVYHG